MFLRSTKRKKDGKEHRYWSVVESIRQACGPVHQKTLLYLGELNGSEQASWTKALEVFNTDSGQSETRSLFPSDRTPPATDAPALSLRLADYRLSHPRQYGACWLTSELWRELGLDQFWEQKLEPSREGTDWARLLQVWVAYRLIAPGSEWRCHRQWYDRSAMGDLLGPDFHWSGKDQLYLVLDRLLEHRPALFTHLQDRFNQFNAIAQATQVAYSVGMPALTTHRFTVEDYYRMAESGVLKPEARVELVDGQILDMSPIGPFHGGVTKRLIRLFSNLAQGRWIVAAQDPVRLDAHSEPQPDVMLLQPASDDYIKRHPRPEEVFLLIEVADSTLAYDRGEKLPAYGRAGISEVWLINLPEQSIEVYREPHFAGYASASVLRAGEQARPAAFPDVAVDVRTLLRQTD